MSWVITGTQKIDPDAAVYLSRVEAADGQTLETGVRTAVESFIVGCKVDGIWSAIKASCILAGARTRLGALVPLVGVAPTSFSFVDADYDRKTGLVGNAGTKYLSSNRNNNADPQDSKHLSVYATTAASSQFYACDIGIDTGAGRAFIGRIGDQAQAGLHSGAVAFGSSVGNGFRGISRASSSSYSYRFPSSNGTISGSSVAPLNGNILVYRVVPSGGSTESNARLAFYSIGEALDLALLDARVTDLINAIGAAF